MDENYIDVVRKSLYRDSQNKAGTSQEMPRKSKKIKFSVDKYNSDNVFAKPKSEKLQDRKCTPYKKKDSKKKKLTQNGDSSAKYDTKLDNGEHKLKYRKPTPFKNNLPKKRVVIFDSSESFEEDMKDDISPSKSEIALSKGNLKKLKSTKKKRKKLFDESSDSEDITEFNLNKYFDSCDVSMNESITDTHSGIEYEFASKYAKGGRIISSDLSVNEADEGHFQQDTECDESIAKDVIEINESDISLSDNDEEFVPNENDEDISKVASKLQESMTFDDEQVETVGSPSNSCHSSQSEDGYSDTEHYSVEDWELVILKQNHQEHVHGLFSLKVLYGKVEILGHTLDEYSKEVNLYSPRGSALLQIKNVTEPDSIKKLELNEIVPNFTFDDTVGHTVVKTTSAVIKCTILEDPRMSFIRKYISQQIFPTVGNCNLPGVAFVHPIDYHFDMFKANETWDAILNDFRLSTKMLLAGGKSVGKSTFLRYAINRLLNKFDKVRVIDLDPGQSEFAVPGCVSIVSITEPIFGPNYTHLKTAERSLLSNINVGHDPDAYIKCVKHLAAFSETLEECPTLINFMGFSQGIGLNIISSAITYIQPTDVVQIQSRKTSKNYKANLSPDTVQENCNMFASHSVLLDYKLHILLAMNDDNEEWSLEPRQSREMCVLAYLSGMMPRGVNSIMSHELPMYEIKLSNIKIMNLQKEEIAPAIANANLVALCSLEAESNIFTCFGYGIVRGIDLDSQSLVLLTPETRDVLEQVYHLVIGSVMLPPSIYMTPDDVRGSIPYVMKGELVSLGQLTKRSYVPVNKK